MNSYLANIMKTVNKQLSDKFEKNLANIKKDQLTTKVYIMLLLGSFISLSKSCFSDNIEVAKRSCKQCIHETSLNEPEYMFFEKLVDEWNDKKMDQNSLNNIEKLYNETDDLANCQLGDPIHDCITLSSKYINTQ